MPVCTIAPDSTAAYVAIVLLSSVLIVTEEIYIVSSVPQLGF